MTEAGERWGSLTRWAHAMSLVGLAVVGIFRPVLPELLRSRWLVVIVLLALTTVAAQMARIRLAPAADPYRQALSALFPIILCLLYVQPSRVASDGIFYFAPLRSVVVDFDLDLENEYRTLGALPSYFQRTPTGRLPNNFSIGPAIAWAPLYGLTHATALAGAFRPTGYGYPYFTAVATTSAFLGFLGVVWTYRLLRFYSSGEMAFVAAVLLCFGSSHLWYMAFEPSMSHAPAMAAVAGFLLRAHRGPSGVGSHALSGAAGGLVMLMRWQNLLFLPVALATGWARAAAAGRRPRAGELAAFFGAAALVFLPQAIYWKLIYGSFLLVPQGGSYVQLDDPHIAEVLFSSRHGLFAWTPLLWLGLVGLLCFIPRAPVLGFSLLAALGASIYLNASIQDWWAGAAFGGRRFDGALPAFGLGLAVAVEGLTGWLRRHALAGAALALLPFLLWNWMLIGLYAGGGISLDGALSWRQAAADGLELIYRRTGYPFSWPGALTERIRQGVPLAVYDLAGARRGANNVEIRMGDTDGLHLGPGWSLPRRRNERTYREGSPEGARLYVDLNEPAPYRLTLEARGPAEVHLEVNGQLAGTLRLAEGWVVAGTDLPRDLVASGMNVITLRSADAEALAVSRFALVRPGEP